MASDDDTTDLSEEQRRRIEAVHASLHRTHYELLGVDATADKKTIKRAYFALTAEFHTDRYFGKNLGRYRAMMDAIFARLTQAHDVLTSPARAEYDASLNVAAPPPAPPPKAPGQRLISGVQPTLRAAEVDLEARRQALARRLVGGTGRPKKP